MFKIDKGCTSSHAQRQSASKGSSLCAEQEPAGQPVQLASSTGALPQPQHELQLATSVCSCSSCHSRSKHAPLLSSSRHVLVAAPILLLLLLITMNDPTEAVRQPEHAMARAKTWSYFNIDYFDFPGIWNDQIFQCHVWLRLVCHNSTTHTARLVVSLQDAPLIRPNPDNVHSITPPEFLNSNGSLPELWFQGVEGDVLVVVKQFWFKELIKNATDAAAVTASAEVPAGMALTLRMEGSERVYQVKRQCSPLQHPLFAHQSVWLGIVDATSVQDIRLHKEHTRNTSKRTSSSSSSNTSAAKVEAEVEAATGTNAVSNASIRASPTGDASSSKGNQPGSGSIAGNGSYSSHSHEGNMTAAPNPVGSTLGSIARKLLGRLVDKAKQAAHTADARGTGPSARISSYLMNDRLEDFVLENDQHTLQKLDDTSTATGSTAANSIGSSSTGSAGTAHERHTTPATSSSSGTVGLGVLPTYDDLLPPASIGKELMSGVEAAPAPTPAPGGHVLMAGDYAPTETSLPMPASFPSFFSDLLDNSSRGIGSSSGSSFGSMAFSGVLPEHGDILKFLTLQHLLHHKELGFSGTIMVVMRHTADILLESAALRRAVAKRRLVLVLWDLGLEPRASHFMQVPAYNLLRLAAWGSNSTLALWDLDEYLVLPQHRLITDEIYGESGCMKEFLEDASQAIIPSMWARSNIWQGTAEVVGWMQHGRWARAIQNMDYAMWPYTFCDGTCKAIINPTSDYLFQVHQHMTSPRTPVHPVSWRCGYILHFYRLWTVRLPTLMTYMGYVNAPAKVPGVPLLMEDVLPHSMLVRLANMARVYAGMLALNPTLATVATSADARLSDVKSKVLKVNAPTASPPANATSKAGR